MALVKLITLSCVALTMDPIPGWIVLFLVAALVFYIGLFAGVYIIAPEEHKRCTRPKVFCIGLSRTGTTSISVALNMLGFEAHHQCADIVDLTGAKPRVRRFWADAFDAHADVAPATVFEELAQLYPDARFVLTRREPRKWGRAMIRFCAKNWPIFYLPVRPPSLPHMALAAAFLNGRCSSAITGGRLGSTASGASRATPSS